MKFGWGFGISKGKKGHESGSEDKCSRRVDGAGAVRGGELHDAGSDAASAVPEWIGREQCAGWCDGWPGRPTAVADRTGSRGAGGLGRGEGTRAGGRAARGPRGGPGGCGGLARGTSPATGGRWGGARVG